MSFDNPSREANPWATLKRTVKTKSLRFVRLAIPFQPGRTDQCYVKFANLDFFEHHA
jgi:hypothetical protein